MIRKKLYNFFESHLFQKIIVSIIVLNAVLIGLETSETYMQAFGHIIDNLDLIILGVFIVEFILKLYAYRVKFFHSVWNIFDASIVIISIIPAAGSFTVFRALRIIRTLRLLKNVPKLKIIIESLLLAVPSIGWIMVLLMIIFYVFAVIGTNLFGANYPELFGSLGDSFFTLFQIMTLESWASAIARPIMETNSILTVIYFVTFILLATYTTLNIFIAIVVNTMNELHHKDIMEEEAQLKSFIVNNNEQVLKKLDELSKEVNQLKKREENNVDF